MARVKIDEGLSTSVGQFFEAKGHDVATILSQGLGGKKDHEIWPVVKSEGRMLVTIDLDFSDARAYPPGSHPGILIFRVAQESRKQYEILARMVVENVDLDALTGAIIIATPAGIRIRKPGTV